MPPAASKDKAVYQKVFKATNRVEPSMIAAGYSPHSARMGKARLPQDWLKWTERRQGRIAKEVALARATTAETQEDFVRGSLLVKAMDAEDGPAIKALELLGKDKRVAMFTADTQIGIITITPPPALMQAITQRLSAVTIGDKLLEGKLETLESHDQAPAEPP